VPPGSLSDAAVVIPATHPHRNRARYDQLSLRCQALTQSTPSRFAAESVDAPCKLLQRFRPNGIVLPRPGMLCIVPMGFVPILLKARSGAQWPGIGVVSPGVGADQALLTDALRRPIGDVTQDLVVVRGVVVLHAGVGRD